MTKKIINICIVIIVLIISFIVGVNSSNKECKVEETKKEEIVTKTLYSWNKEDFNEKKYHLLEVIEERKITDIYHEFGKSLEEYDEDTLTLLKKKNINIYHLTGDPSWAYEEDASSIKSEIDKIIEFNKTSPLKIKGIVLDIEPYASESRDDSFTEEMLSIYEHTIETGYNYAKEKGLQYVICIPTWYDKVNVLILKEIIRNADRIEVMNYATRDTLVNIENEVKFAKELNKEIISIYEVDFEYDYRNDEYQDGIFYSYKEMDDDFKVMYQKYNYDKLFIGYHYFTKM